MRRPPKRPMPSQGSNPERSEGTVDAHTQMGGKYVENTDDTVLYGVIDKIMSLFE